MLVLKPRILIFIDWFLPGYKAGGPVQSCVNMIEHLKEEFDFFVITRNTDYCEVKPFENIKSDGWTKLSTYLQVYYASERKLSYGALAKAAREVKPDMIFINGIYSLYFSIFPLLISKKFNNVKVFVSARGMLAPSAINVKGSKKKLYLRMAKALGFYRNVCFHATNNTEELHIRNLFGQTQKIRVAPNLPKNFTFAINGLSKQTGKLRLASIARISTEKNTKYAIKVLLKYTFEGSIVFDILGPVYDEAYWTECIELIKFLPSNIQVNYRGSIEHAKVTETLQQYHALFLPTCGENFGHIILESFAAGRPVIISDQTPWRSLEEQNLGYDLPLSKPAAFAESLQDMLNKTQGEYDKLTNAAYLYAQQVSQDKQALELNRLLFR